MLILRIYPFALYRPKENAEGKTKRKINRIKALSLGLPPCKKTLYYDSSLKTRAEDFAGVFGELALKPKNELFFSEDDECRILMDVPERLSADLYAATGKRVDFDDHMAVLSKKDPTGRETVQWIYRAKDLIFFAYPEEIVVPFRKGTDISLQKLLLPKIEEGFKKILKNLDTFIREPWEVESVHQYRVSIRRFRALISMVKPILNPSSYAKIQDIFRQKGRDAELLRELDVLMEEWDKVREPEQVHLKNALMEQRKREEERLLALLKTDRIREELKEGLNTFMHSLSMSDWHEIDGVFLLDQRLHNWYRYTLEALWRMEEFDLPFVHRIRLKSKKYRYVTEFFDDHTTLTQVMHHKKAKKRQTVLGEVCDALRNREAIRELEPYFDDKALEEAAYFIKKEEQRENQLLHDLGLRNKTADSNPHAAEEKSEVVEESTAPASTHAQAETPERADKIEDGEKAQDGERPAERAEAADAAIEPDAPVYFDDPSKYKLFVVGAVVILLASILFNKFL
ncbi:CHAD domain-containing protein [Peptoniphilus ivorii]|uniref:CHAD domain-containing protein n=1 Tax=Aedoeadaptatus ivorii TaxID=54006 RepID=UPI002785CACD|nr:CHAD domain-containing protein [Peptoniphilus ivorii]MDQ0508216.1 CHAD domain-containing protein [Peptoniphilus ivorii]